MVWGIKLTSKQLLPFLKLHSKSFRKEINESDNPVNVVISKLWDDVVPLDIGRKYSIIRLISNESDPEEIPSYFFQIGTDIISIRLIRTIDKIKPYTVPLVDDVSEFYQFIKDNDLSGSDDEIELWTVPWVSY